MKIGPPQAHPPEPEGLIERIKALDGIRGLAVLAVLLFHLRVPGFGWGYLGVDVFFVLSGFLITGVMLGEVQRKGRLSLTAFWTRRAKRLLPALLVLLVVVTMVSARTYTSSQREELRRDAVATTLYVANWRFIDTSDYFNDTGTRSPFEHTWSLAIEEQFYVLWPVTVLLALGAARRWRGRERSGATAIGWIAAMGAAGSAITMALVANPQAVERAYMGTDARVFEPLIGAAAAAFISKRPSWRPSRQIMILGLVLISLGIERTQTDPWSYFRGMSLIFGLGVVAVILAMARGTPGRVSSILSSPPLVGLGVISYGVYLWHWPLVTWMRISERAGIDLFKAGVVVASASIAIAWLSYRFVEQPIRSGGLGRSLTPSRAAIAASAAMVLTASAVIIPTAAQEVGFGSAKVLLVGDSVPRLLLPALERIGERRGIAFTSASFGGCPATGERVVRSSGEPFASDRCDEVKSLQEAQLAAADPDLVVWWDRFALADFELRNGTSVPAGSDLFWKIRRKSLPTNAARFLKSGARLILVAAEPPGIAMADRCTSRKCDDWHRRQIDHYDDVTLRWNQMMFEFAERRLRVEYVDIAPVICPAGVRPLCDDRIDGIPARFDGTHYRGAGAVKASEELVGQITEWLAGQ